MTRTWKEVEGLEIGMRDREEEERWEGLEDEGRWDIERTLVDDDEEALLLLLF